MEASEAVEQALPVVLHWVEMARSPYPTPSRPPQSPDAGLWEGMDLSEVLSVAKTVERLPAAPDRGSAFSTAGIQLFLEEWLWCPSSISATA